MNISPFLSVDQSCDETLQWTTKQLSRAGLRPIQTFDLHAARLAMHDCPCPNHGTDECDCQMVVLLVYGKVAEPATLILHGNGGQTKVSFAGDLQQQADPQLIDSIQLALEIKAPASISQAE
jgi:hypothetical protein